jgi:hypothetical protein
MLFDETTTTESVQVTEIEGLTYSAPAPTELARLGKYAVGQIPAAARPLFDDVAPVAIVVVVEIVVAVAIVVVVATGATVVEGSAFQLSFLPTLAQISGLLAEPPSFPSFEHEPPALAADTCWVKAVVAKRLAITIATIFLDLDMPTG